MSGLRWKIDRLKAMGAREILSRMREAAQSRFESMGWRRAHPPVPDARAFGKPWVGRFPDEAGCESCIALAERLLAGEWPVFDQPAMPLGFPPDWNRDPRTGTRAPLRFGKTLDYRRADLVGDIKYLWEPNRHLELFALAQAWHCSGDTRYLNAVKTLLDNWFAACPYPYGPNWTSSLELAVRLLNWAATWQVLGGADSPIFDGEAGAAFRVRWLDSVFRHCHFIRGHLSRHSSANNHLLGELAGLFVASTTWPCWPQSGTWRQEAMQSLVREVLAQNAPDGINREQAIWYQHEVMDMLLLSMLHGEANGMAFSRDCRSRLEAMMDFVCATMDAGGNVPCLGDGDDAVMVRFDRSAAFDPFRSLLATGAVLFGRPDFAHKAGCFDVKSRWLLGDAANAAFEGLLASSTDAVPKQAFPDGGYWVLGGDWNSDSEIRLIADAGALGYLSIAAHGHADALAFTLSLGGQPFLIDPGTFSYHADGHWRNYFKGTSAHNTLRVDGVDQSVPAGKFLWLRHARARCLDWSTTPERERWEAEHDGYRRLNDPVTHRRRIELDKRTRVLTVTDELLCRGEHEVEMFWHFGEAWQIDGTGQQFEARCENRRVNMELDAGMRSVVFYGDASRPAGWLSRRYGEKTPCPTLVAQARICGQARFMTRFDLAGEGWR